MKEYVNMLYLSCRLINILEGHKRRWQQLIKAHATFLQYCPAALKSRH